MFLTTVLAPLTPAEFVRDYWGQRPLHVKGGLDRIVSAFGTAFGPGVIDQLIAKADREVSGVRRIEGFMRSSKLLSAAETYGDLLRVPVAPRAVRTMLAAGATVAIYNVDTLHDPFARRSAELRSQLRLPGRLTCNLWISEQGAGMATHFDREPGMQVQLSGEKTWRLSPRPEVDWPRSAAFLSADGTAEIVVDGWTQERRRIAVEDFFEVTMQPGDFLYFPGGTWHETTCESPETSVGLGFFIDPLPVRAVFDHLFDAALEGADGWHRMLPLALQAEDDGTLPSAVGAFLAERLGELQAVLRDLDPGGAEVHRAYRKAIAQGQPRPAFVVARPREVAVERQDRLRVASTGVLTGITGHGPDGGALMTLFFGDEEICFDDPRMVPFAQALTSTPEFVAESSCAWGADGPYAWEEVAEMLHGLLTLGVLEHAPSELR